MDISHLQRNKKKVLSAIGLSEDKTISIAKKPIKIMFPRSYINNKLGFIDDHFNVLGQHCIIVDDKYYAVSNVIAIISLLPSSVSVTKVDDVEYYVLGFDEGSVISPNLNVIQNNKLAYEVQNEFVNKGKTPWYWNIVDSALLFRSAKKYASVDLKTDMALLSMLAASRARLPKDRHRYFKESLKTQEDLLTKPVDFIGNKSIAFSTTSTVPRILGSYAREGTLSAMVDQTETLEPLDELLRS